MTKGLTQITFAKLLEEGSTDLDSDTKVTDEALETAERSAQRGLLEEMYRPLLLETNLTEPLREMQRNILGLR